jgi:hypothetical protein
MGEGVWHRLMEPAFVDIFAGSMIADEAWYFAQQQATNGPAPPDSSWTPQNLADLPDVPPVTPTLGGLGLVYPGKRHVFSGPQESAKTLAAYVIGLAVIRSGSPVVLIDFEMGPWDAKTRLKELGASDDDLGSLLYVEPDTGPGAHSVTRLCAHNPALVVLDAAAGAFSADGLDDNSRKDVERWSGAWVTPFWKAGIATIVLDHVTKNVETRGSYAIGSERKVGGADVHLGFSVITPIRRGSHGRYQITTHKDRGGCLKRGKLATFELHSDPETHHFTWAFVPAQEVDEEHAFRPTGLMEKVSRWLEMQVDPQPRSAIEKAKLGKGEYVRIALDLLLKEGYLEESEGARGARLTEVVRAYREAQDDLVPTSSHLVPEIAESTSSLVPPPFRGDEDVDGVDGTGTTSSQGVLEEDDGIPF